MRSLLDYISYYIALDIVIWTEKPNFTIMPRKGESYIERPQGAPRGLLLHFILYKISLKPYHGYELLREIEENTAGAWRPGPGSIYPMLKKLVSEGYIRSESPKRAKSALTVYLITHKGKLHMQEIRKVFASAGQKWGGLYRLFVEMLDPADLPKMFVDGSRKQFEVTREILDTKKDLISGTDLEYMMKEYSLNLQRQLDWSDEILSSLKRGVPVRAEANIASR